MSSRKWFNETKQGKVRAASRILKRMKEKRRGVMGAMWGGEKEKKKKGPN